MFDHRHAFEWEISHVVKIIHAVVMGMNIKIFKSLTRNKKCIWKASIQMCFSHDFDFIAYLCTYVQKFSVWIHKIVRYVVQLNKKGQNNKEINQNRISLLYFLTMSFKRYKAYLGL